jgi:scyllo-inositol 2-dehydrogenase (NADP+)
MINAALLGLGKMGSIYLKTLKNNKNIDVKYILKNTKIKNSKTNANIFYNKNKFFLHTRKKVKAYIVASPIDTHFEYIKKIITLKKNIIIEKPIVKNAKELNKLKLLVKKTNQTVIVNHIDIYNPAFEQLKKKIKLIGDYRNTKIEFGKYKKIYKSNIPNIIYPYFDWLPHPLAISIVLFGSPKDVKILSIKTRVSKNFIFQKMHLQLIYTKQNVDILFSNDVQVPKRKFTIKGKKGSITYDAYKKKSLLLKIKNKKDIFCKFNKTSPLKNLLNSFYSSIINKKKINDLQLSIKVMNTLFVIQKKLKKYNHL